MTDTPFLGQLRAVHYAVVDHISLYARAATRLEQWNGKEWVLVLDLQPDPGPAVVGGPSVIHS